MTKTMVINNQRLSVRKFKGQAVLTFKDIDLVHSRPEGTASRNFRANKNHFIEGVDYFKIQPDEIRRVGITSPNGGIVITESGYLMLVKSFTDDLAWDTQRALLTFYFNSKKSAADNPKQLTLETSEYHYFDKTYKGQPVLSVKDIEHFTGLSTSMINWYLRKGGFIPDEDYYRLERFTLREFKAENPNIRKTQGSPFHVVTKSGFIKLMEICGCRLEMPKCFEKPSPLMIEEKKSGGLSMYTPNEEMNALMAEVRDKAQRIQAFSYLLTNTNLTASSRMFRGELRCEIQRLNMMIDKIDDVRF